MFTKEEILSELNNLMINLSQKNVTKNDLTDILDEVFNDYKNNYDFQDLVDSDEFGNVNYQLKQPNANKDEIESAIKNDPDNYDQYLIHDKEGYHQVSTDEAIDFLTELSDTLDDSLDESEYYDY